MDNNLKRLIIDVKSGNQAAFEKLRDRYKPLIESSVQKYSCDIMTAEDREEMYQEALFVLYNAACTYTLENEGVEFGLYAKICIENSMLSFVRAYKRRNRVRALSLDGEATGTLTAENEDVLQSVIDEEQASFLAARISKCLSKYENRVWWAYASGASAKDIAKKLGTDEKSVSNAVYRIRKKLRNVLSDKQR